MSVGVPFTKMSGAGNDFVVLDAHVFEALPGDRAAWVRAVCRRGLSVGADGVLVVSSDGSGRVGVLFFNPDGGEAFCGNGSRCAARYAATHLALPDTMTLLTAAGDVRAVVDGPVVSLTLPPPADLGEVVLGVGHETFRGRWILAGVPHVVFSITGLRAYPLERVGPPLRRHETLGPPGANVNLVETDSDGRIHVRTFERGVENETLSCGTGAVAVAYAARLTGAGERIVVVPRSGAELTVVLPGEAARPSSARLIGDARIIFEGVLDPEATGSAS